MRVTRAAVLASIAGLAIVGCSSNTSHGKAGAQVSSACKAAVAQYRVDEAQVSADEQQSSAAADGPPNTLQNVLAGRAESDLSRVAAAQQASDVKVWAELITTYTSCFSPGDVSSAKAYLSDH